MAAERIGSTFSARTSLKGREAVAGDGFAVREETQALPANPAAADTAVNHHRPLRRHGQY
jgi:hypothetical protein